MKVIEKTPGHCPRGEGGLLETSSAILRECFSVKETTRMNHVSTFRGATPLEAYYFKLVVRRAVRFPLDEIWYQLVGYHLSSDDRAFPCFMAELT